MAYYRTRKCSGWRVVGNGGAPGPGAEVCTALLRKEDGADLDGRRNIPVQHGIV